MRDGLEPPVVARVAIATHRATHGYTEIAIRQGDGSLLT